MGITSNRIQVFFRVISNEIYSKKFLDGLLTTVKIAVYGLIIGIIIGALIAVVKVAPKYKLGVRILDKICSVYVAIFRGTPMVVQLLLMYYILFPMLGINRMDGINVNNVAAITVFGMNSGAYVSEIMRGGLNSVDYGQMEAGRALGLGYGTTMIKIVIPQAIKNILPTLGNEFITLIKETSVLSFIAVTDLYTVIEGVGKITYAQSVAYIFMAFVYIALILCVTLLIKILEKILARSDRNKTKKSKKSA